VLGFRGGVSEATDEIWGFAALVGGGEEGKGAEGASCWVEWCCRTELLWSSLTCTCVVAYKKKNNAVVRFALLTTVPCMMEFWLVWLGGERDGMSGGYGDDVRRTHVIGDCPSECSGGGAWWHVYS